jgi:hypothetical protein
MMIVLLDTNRRMVLLYQEAGMKEIPFSEINEINAYLQDQQVFYVTNATEVNGNDIVDLVNSLRDCKYEVIEESLEGQNLYIHSVNDKNIFVPIDEEHSFKLKGKYDCMPYNDETKATIANSPILQGLMKKGEISIIGENTKKRIAKELKLKIKEKTDKDHKKEQALDDLIVEGTVDDLLAGGKVINRDDVEEMDLSNDRGGQTMEELTALFNEAGK